MSIGVELALILGLFIIGAVVLAIDNLVYALSRRWSRWMHKAKILAPLSPLTWLTPEKTVVTECADVQWLSITSAHDRHSRDTNP